MVFPQRPRARQLITTARRMVSRLDPRALGAYAVFLALSLVATAPVGILVLMGTSSMRASPSPILGLHVSALSVDQAAAVIYGVPLLVWLGVSALLATLPFRWATVPPEPQTPAAARPVPVAPADALAATASLRPPRVTPSTRRMRPVRPPSEPRKLAAPRPDSSVYYRRARRND